VEYSEFQEQMGELADFYGEKNFSPRVNGIIWQIVQRLTVGDFKAVIQILVEEGARPPNPAAIRKAAMPYIRRAEQNWRQSEVKKLEELKERCKSCDGSGYVFALLRANPAHEYSFACPACEAPRVRGFKVAIGPTNDPKAVRLWEDSLKPEFIPVSHKLESMKAASAYQLSRAEAQICLSWCKRLKENRYALDSFKRAGGTIPVFLKNFLHEKGINVPMGDGHGLEARREQERGGGQSPSEVDGGAGVGDPPAAGGDTEAW
jgi:hypothetical protein